jgi:hypothetical protein
MGLAHKPKPNHANSYHLDNLLFVLTVLIALAVFSSLPGLYAISSPAGYPSFASSSSAFFTVLSSPFLCRLEVHVSFRQILLADLRHADQQRQHWHSLIAQEVLAEPDLLSLVRLCGVREILAFALAAFIGDIQRLATPKKLVK